VTAPLLEIRDLVKVFPGDRRRPPVRAVDGVSLDVRAGEVVGLVGPSGCGKSTLARLAMRLLAPTSGSIRLDGVDLADAGPEALAAARRTAQIVFQDPTLSLDPRLSVGASVAEPLAIHGRPQAPWRTRRAARRRRVQELLATVRLPADAAARRPGELSGGERQRVAIARALALDPRLLILDEPFASLDASVGAQVMELLAQLRASRGLAYLLIAHDLAVVRAVSDRVAVMDEGRIVEASDAERLYADPRHPRTRELLRAAQLLSRPPCDWPGSTTQA
jgi:ABC-type glutathione transport system ATPase component